MFSLISFKYCENQNIEIPKMIYTFKFPTKRLSYNLLISLKNTFPFHHHALIPMSKLVKSNDNQI